MSFFCCCHCVSATPGEREALTAHYPKQPCRDIGGDVFSKEGTLTMKLVNVLEIDMLFSDIAETFNKQHGDHWAMKEAIQRLKEVSGCAPTNSLAACIENIKQQHGACNVQVHMEGYRFSLVAEEKEVPEKLEQAQRQVGELNHATKCVIAMEMKLQEMVCSVLQRQSQLEETVKAGNPEYLDQVRLEVNLRENFQKVSLAKDLSKQYGEDASRVLKEMSQLAGLTL
ncbi:uncharacterized protein LOC120382984 isoform X1 [Mauremys reevesii]|uniref:uncharacterized protein LOC120382984 isoform X1 n=1 Tax=Mauremys reevesii TaxID=260615 RepID=UPI00193F3457|nr:uncharacterized protein LOC120382984 isoform X1 [Mauremys reevesii]